MITNVSFDCENYLGKNIQGGIQIETSIMDINGGRRRGDNQLKQIFDEARTPHGTLDNVMRVHSL